MQLSIHKDLNLSTSLHTCFVFLFAEDSALQRLYQYALRICTIRHMGHPILIHMITIYNSVSMYTFSRTSNFCRYNLQNKFKIKILKTFAFNIYFTQTSHYKYSLLIFLKPFDIKVVYSNI